MPKLTVKSPKEARGSDFGHYRKGGRNSEFVSKSMAISKQNSSEYVGYTGQDRRFLDAIKQIRQKRTDEILSNVNADNCRILYQS